MRRRILYLVEMIAIAGVIFLGAGWPSPYTLVALIGLPAFFIAGFAVFRPTILGSQSPSAPRRRRGLRFYVHGCAVAASASILYQTVWMFTTHAAPTDLLVPAGLNGPVRILYGVSDGEPSRMQDGRIVYEILRGRVLASSAKQDDGWWYDGERRFFARSGAGLQEISGVHRASGSAFLDECSVSYDDFIIEPAVKVSEDVYREIAREENWNLRCEHGRLTR